MKVKVNNREVECRSAFLSELLSELNLPEKGIAVAVNQCMVPREQWSAYALQEGAEILVIQAVCGG